MPHHLIDAVKKGYVSVAFSLISKNPAIVHETDGEGNTALIWAASKGYTKLTELLLGAGSNIVKGNKNGTTALESTLHIWETHKQPDHKKVIDLLLEHWFSALKKQESNINARDNRGRTALFWAVRCDHKEMASWLLTHNANPFIESDTGISPLVYASDRADEAQVQKEMYQMIHKKAFPWIYEDAIPEHIRTLLSGHQWRQPADGKPLQITYSFDKATFTGTEAIGKKISGLRNAAAIQKGEALNLAQRKEVTHAFAHYSSLLNIEFIPAFPEKAQLVIRQADLVKFRQSLPARTDFCTDNEGYITHACISLDSIIMRMPEAARTFTNEDGTKKTHYNEFIKIIKHELGHVFGLKHPDPKYPIIETIMSYTHTGMVDGIYPSTLMPNDLQALLTMYPANKNYNIADNIYRGNGKGRFLQMITDQGGEDLLDVSLHTGDAHIDLRPGMISTAGRNRFVIAPETKIEHVKGAQGNNDITDNSLDNVIDVSTSKGNATVRLGEGRDTVKTGSGPTLFVIDTASEGSKHITGFKPGKDTIEMKGFTSPAIIEASGTSTSLHIGKTTLILKGVGKSSLPAHSVQYSGIVESPAQTPVSGNTLEQCDPMADRIKGAHEEHTSLARINSSVTLATPELSCFYPDGTTNIVSTTGQQPNNALIAACRLPGLQPPSFMQTMTGAALNTAPMAGIVAFTDTSLRNRGYYNLANIFSLTASTAVMVSMLTSSLSSGCGVVTGSLMQCSSVTAPFAPVISSLTRIGTELALNVTIAPVGTVNFTAMVAKECGNLAGGALGYLAGREAANQLVPQSIASRATR